MDILLAVKTHISSPNSCPKISLTAFNPFKSMNNTHEWLEFELELIVLSSTSIDADRFIKPVNESVFAFTFKVNFCTQRAIDEATC